GGSRRAGSSRRHPRFGGRHEPIVLAGFLSRREGSALRAISRSRAEAAVSGAEMSNADYADCRRLRAKFARRLCENLRNLRFVFLFSPGRRPSEVAASDQAGVTVDLADGTNQLFLQVSYRGDKEVVYARFVDPERKSRC